MMDLFTIHFFYIVLCVGFSWYSGYIYGSNQATKSVIKGLIEDKLLDTKKLIKFYKL